jgi:HEPN domain-containing protein
MNRNDFQRLAELRLQESKALLAEGFPEGAYYLAGYAAECALKACIARRTREHDFPEKGSGKYYSHDLEDLVGFAKLRTEFEQTLQANPTMDANWIIVQAWSEESRYETGRTSQLSTDLIRAIENQTGGLLPWLRQRW